jgi:hypothetical protein
LASPTSLPHGSLDVPRSKAEPDVRSELRISGTTTSRRNAAPGGPTGDYAVHAEAPHVSESESNNDSETDRKGRRKGTAAGAATALGVGVGVALYSATDVPEWIAVGVGLAIGVGVAMGARSKK